MNNEKYYYAPLSYNFEMFEDNAARKTSSPQRNENIVKYKTSKKKEVKHISKIDCFIGLLLIISVFLTINILIKINETTSNIQEVKTKIAQSNAEYKELKVKYQGLISYENLEYKASEMGMCPAKNNQIVYFKANKNNKCKTYEECKNSENGQQ